MRLFLAIKPTRPAEAQIARVLLALQDAAGHAATAVKWTPATNVHATLHFLGEVNGSRLDALREILAPPLEQPSFELSLGGAGVFPPAGAPRVIWLDVVAGADPMLRVHAELASRLATAGFSVESRPFTPHLTVARVRDRDRAQAKSIRDAIQHIHDTDVTWIVECVTLFKSDLGGAVPRYEDLLQTDLAISSPKPQSPSH